jgi:integrase/recombinase XerC
MEMKDAIGKFIEYLRSVRNASPLTLLSYQTDLDQFHTFLTPPGSVTPALNQIDHRMIREFMGDLLDRHFQKSSIVRKLAALRSFFKFCAREGLILDNPARLVARPRVPQRLPSILSAEEMNAFLDQLATLKTPAPSKLEVARSVRSKNSARLLLDRDRAMLELLYASGLRVSELTGLNVDDIERKEQMLRVLGKGNKERIIPYGSKAEQALGKYWPVRAALLAESGSRGDAQAVFLNHAGRRLTAQSVGGILKKYVRLVNINWDLHPHSLRHAFATHRATARFRRHSATPIPQSGS